MGYLLKSPEYLQAILSAVAIPLSAGVAIFVSHIQYKNSQKLREREKWEKKIEFATKLRFIAEAFDVDLSLTLNAMEKQNTLTQNGLLEARTSLRSIQGMFNNIFPQIPENCIPDAKQFWEISSTAILCLDSGINELSKQHRDETALKPDYQYLSDTLTELLNVNKVLMKNIAEALEILRKQTKF